MLLQRQYSLWKSVNTLIAFILIWFVIISLFFQWRISNTESNIKKQNASIVNLDVKLKSIKEEKNYKKFTIANFVKKTENNTNYYALYKYLNSIKNTIQKVLKKSGIKTNRFQLSVSKQQVKISTAVPDYNFLYDNKWWIFTMLEKRPFVEKIFVNSYKSANWLIYFDIKLKTK